MGVATQGANEIAVGGYGTDAAVVFVEHRRADDDGAFDAVGFMIYRWNAVDNGVDVGF